MTIFWILAAGLVGLASLFVALPLLKRPSTVDSPRQDDLNLQVFRQRLSELDGDLASGFLDQGQYDAARRDLERELLHDLDGEPNGRTESSAVVSPKRPEARYPLLASALVLMVSAGSVLVYLQLGERDIIPRIEAMSAVLSPHGGAPGAGAAPLEVLVEGLAQRMEKNPDNLEGWLMLGRTYFAIGQAPKALQAVERAYKLAPEDTSVLIAYAEALAANNGNRLEGRPAELIRRVLSAEPANPSARWLDGMLAYQETRFADATAIWEGILGEMDPAGEEAQQMRQMIAEAKAQAGIPSRGEQTSPAKGPTVEAPPPAADSPDAQDRAATIAPGKPRQEADADGRIQVAVSLDPAVSAQAAPEDAVFIYARAAAGPPMPLAVQRYRVADLPVNVTLDDSMAMVPAMRLSAFPEVVVGARVSKSGQATPQSGDLEGQTGPVAAVQSPKVSVTIDRVRP